MNFNMFVTLNIVNANITFFVQVNIVQIIDIYIYKNEHKHGEGCWFLKEPFVTKNYRSFLTGGGSNWNRFFCFFFFLACTSCPIRCTLIRGLQKHLRQTSIN